VVAVSIPNSEWGQCAALIVPGIASSPERDALDDRLYDAVVSELGRVAAPRVIHHVEALPRLSNGKIDLLAVAQIVREIGE
jgi:acyl-coenzyme A synthetase/AMP-(fatty) acid ligase